MISIIFNAPPRAGKDTLGNELARILGCTTAQFKDKLYAEVDRWYELPMGYTRKANEAMGGAFKNMPHTRYNGNSVREALIHVSERVIKPKHGADYFGLAATAPVYEAIRKDQPYIIFTDGGFREELLPIAEISDLVILVQLAREGCTYKGDSRRYIKAMELPTNCRIISIRNNSTVAAATIAIRTQLLLILGDYIHEY